MCVAVIGFAMRGPAGMAHTGIGMKVFADKAVFELGYFPLFLIYAKIIIEQCDSGTIVSTIL
jgi:hypothetical protein